MLVECSSRSGKTSSWIHRWLCQIFFPQKRMKLHTLKLPVNIAICCTLSYCQEIYARDMPLTHTRYLCDGVDCDLEYPPPCPSMKNLLPVSRLLNVPQNTHVQEYSLSSFQWYHLLSLQACMEQSLVQICLLQIPSTVPFFFPFCVITVDLLIYLLVFLGKVQAHLYRACRVPIDF